jgi:RimJ/RimL family protein N-acetyltransferase
MEFIITLKEMTIDKLDDYIKAINNCTPACYENAGGKKTFTHEEIKDYLERIITDESRFDYFMMLEGNIIGEVVLNEISKHDSANIRLAIYDDQHFSKGFGSYAMRTLIQKGFTELALHRIELEVYDFNTRGLALYKKLGFVQEGILRDAYKKETYHDIIIMSLLEDEFKG